MQGEYDVLLDPLIKDPLSKEDQKFFLDREEGDVVIMEIK